MKSNSKWDQINKKSGRESNPIGNKIPKPRRPDDGSSPAKNK